MEILLEFEEQKVTKEDWEDSECSRCGNNFRYRSKAYTIHFNKGEGYLQFCEICMNELLKENKK